GQLDPELGQALVDLAGHDDPFLLAIFAGGDHSDADAAPPASGRRAAVNRRLGGGMLVTMLPAAGARALILRQAQDEVVLVGGCHEKPILMLSLSKHEGRKCNWPDLLPWTASPLQLVAAIGLAVDDLHHPVGIAEVAEAEWPVMVLCAAGRQDPAP